MENASKALIMAAEVLIGVIIISIGVALFTMFQNFSKENVEKMNESQITEFNNNFLKYYGNVRTYDEVEDELYEGPIRVSAHDIISLVNFAIENNKQYDLKFPNNVSNNDIQSTYYVKVDISKENKNGMENWNEEDKNDFIKNNSLIDGSTPKYYKLKSYEISKYTNRIYHVVFEPI